MDFPTDNGDLVNLLLSNVRADFKGIAEFSVIFIFFLNISAVALRIEYFWVLDRFRKSKFKLKAKGSQMRKRIWKRFSIFVLTQEKNNIVFRTVHAGLDKRQFVNKWLVQMTEFVDMC